MSLTSKSNFKLRIYGTVQTLYIFKPSPRVTTNTHLESDFQMRAIIWPSLQISTPSAVLRFDYVVGRKPATAPLYKTCKL